MKVKYLAICIFLIIMSSCKKGYLDINDNPNFASNTTPDLVLPSALNVTANRQIVGFSFISGWMGQWGTSSGYAPSNTDFTTYRQTNEFDKSVLTAQGGLWFSLYDNLEDYEYVRKASSEAGSQFMEGIAMIMKAHEFQQLVDMFGNVPYTDALQGTTVITPKYDDAKSIYTDLIVKIDQAIIKVKASGGVGVSAGSDIMFGGNMMNWLKFANSLKLRILMRQSELTDRQAYIQSNIAAILAEGSGFLDIDANVNPGYLNTSGKLNPFWAFNYTVTGGSAQSFFTAGKFGVDFYGTPDPASTDGRGRLIYGGTQADTSIYQGNLLGAPAHGQATSSYFGSGVLKGFAQDATIFTASESYFLQSEASLKGYISGNAMDLYQQGITSSFEYLGLSATDAMTYYSDNSNSKVFWDNTMTLSAKLNLIISQKWAAENTITPFEIWCDYRRLPNLAFNKSIPLSKSNNVDVAAVPIRILYPTSEYQTNGANVKAQNQTNNAHHTQKIFWIQ